MKYTLMLITPGLRDLFNRESSKDEIIKTISQYSLHQVLDLIAKIDILLNITAMGDKNLGQTQGDLVRAIMPPSVIDRKKRKFPNEANAFFSRGQLTYLRKLALLHCKFEENEASIWKDLKTKEISNMFLGTNDLFQDEVEISNNPTNEEILSFMIKSHFLNQSAHIKNKLLRAYLMFVKWQKPIENYKSLDALFLDQLGITAMDILSIGFGIISPYFKKKEILYKIPVTINVKDFLGKLKIPAKSIESVLNLLSDDLSTTIKKLEKKDTESGYAIDIFVKKPLLKLEKDHEIRYFCLDVIALIDKFTLNLSWAIGNKNNLTEPMLIYRGNRFEEYLRYILKKYCASKNGLEFLYIDNYGKNHSEELGDGIIIDRERKIAVVFEAKSKQYADAVKTAGDLESLKDTFIKPIDSVKNPKKEKGAAQQLNEAIQKLKKDGLKDHGINPEGFSFFPMITFYDEIPSDEKLQGYFQDLCASNGLFVEQNVFKPEITGISSIETMIETSGEDIVGILTKKHSSNDLQQAPLDAFLYYLRKNNPPVDILKDDFDEMFREIKKILLTF